MEYLKNNYQWIFSGIGVLILGGLITTFRKSIIGLFDNSKTNNQLSSDSVHNESEESNFDELKRLCNILFIDDDAKFKVVTILKKSGWVNTKAVKDLTSIDDTIVKESHILFVDINGVGINLGFKDEGLGLALALKNKYNSTKKVIIYSAETKGDRFHEALRKADNCLSKNADPYQFQKLVEDYSLEIFNKKKK